jgi:hypothetical protein
MAITSHGSVNIFWSQSLMIFGGIATKSESGDKTESQFGMPSQSEGIPISSVTVKALAPGFNGIRYRHMFVASDKFQALKCIFKIFL